MKNLRYESKKKWIGFLFVVPWLLGFLEFFLFPVINSMLYSVSDISIDSSGAVLKFIGFEQYEYLFLTDASFITTMLQTALSVLGNVVLVIVFSLFFATILVQNFKGRFIARAIFFLPAIIASGAVMRSITFGVNGSGRFELNVLQSVLMNANLSAQTTASLVSIMEDLFQIVWKCGVQILIFMAALQAIPPNVKEAAYVEGATGWEYFWKITIPLVMPMIRLNIIYTTVDGFVDLSNPIILRIQNLNQSMDYTFSSAISWIYFVFIFILTIILYMVINIRSRQDRQYGETVI